MTHIKIRRTNIAKLLGENIARHRSDLQISQAELAERIGVSRVSVGRWEIGSHWPNDEQVEGLAKAMKIEAWTLFIPRMGFKVVPNAKND